MISNISIPCHNVTKVSIIPSEISNIISSLIEIFCFKPDISTHTCIRTHPSIRTSYPMEYSLSSSLHLVKNYQRPSRPPRNRIGLMPNRPINKCQIARSGVVFDFLSSSIPKGQPASLERVVFFAIGPFINGKG
mmetsp:Transcript_35555/g.74953  ORF Transcript_35555/g.74953 Transcript_35555/m.74953 type:complete len:134 (-) Transcript_35555:671-1072(-)